MSAIALKWVSTIKVGNATAKHLLLFLASHSFQKDGYYFKNEQVANQLEITIRALQNAYKFLVDKNILKKTERYRQDGSQISNHYSLNIDQEFVDNYFCSPGGDAKDAPLGVNPVHAPPRTTFIPLNSNNTNNNLNNKKRALPDDFLPSQKNIDLVLSRNLDPDIVIGKFIHNARAWGTKRIDWQAALSKWILDEKFIKVKVANNKSMEEIKNETRSTIKFWEPGNPDYDRVNGTGKQMGGKSHGREPIEPRRNEAHGRARNTGVQKAESYLF